MRCRVDSAARPDSLAPGVRMANGEGQQERGAQRKTCAGVKVHAFCAASEITA